MSSRPRPAEPFAGPLTDAAALASVLDHVPAAIGLADLDLRHRFANWAHGFWYGRAPHEVVGLHVSDVVGPAVYEESRRHYDAVCDGVPQAFERTVTTSTGERRHTVVRFEPYLVDGDVAGVLMLASDATNRVRADFARRELARRVAEIDEQERTVAGIERVVTGRLDAMAADLAGAAGTDPACREVVLGVARQVADAARSLRLIAAKRPNEACGGPEARIRGHVATAAGTLGFTPTVAVLGVLDDLDDVRTALIGEALDEALSNVARHAGADRVDVTVSIEGRDIVVVVADDGRGVVRAHAGSGLDRLRRGAIELGGRCTWVINGDDGTTLEWRVPLAPGDAVPTPVASDGFLPDPASARGVRLPPAGYRTPHTQSLGAEELRAVLDQVPMGLSVWDRGVRNQYANATAARWMRMGEPAAMIGRTFASMVPPELPIRVTPLAEAAIAGTHTIVERAFDAARDTPDFIRTEYVPRRIEDRIEGLYVQVTDIGERIRVESAVAADAERVAALRARHAEDEAAHHLAIQQLFAAALRLDTALTRLDPPCSSAIEQAMAPLDDAIADLRRSVVDPGGPGSAGSVAS